MAEACPIWTPCSYPSMSRVVFGAYSVLVPDGFGRWSRLRLLSCVVSGTYEPLSFHRVRACWVWSLVTGGNMHVPLGVRVQVPGPSDPDVHKEPMSLLRELIAEAERRVAAAARDMAELMQDMEAGLDTGEDVDMGFLEV